MSLNSTQKALMKWFHSRHFIAGNSCVLMIVAFHFGEVVPILVPMTVWLVHCHSYKDTLTLEHIVIVTVESTSVSSDFDKSKSLLYKQFSLLNNLKRTPKHALYSLLQNST